MEYLQSYSVSRKLYGMLNAKIVGHYRYHQNDIDDLLSNAYFGFANHGVNAELAIYNYKFLDLTYKSLL